MGGAEIIATTEDATTSRGEGATPTMESAAIDAGVTGEKVPGYDPATAPMETDAEAGGTASETTSDPVPLAKAGANPNATSHASALRKPILGDNAESKANARFAGMMGGFILVFAAGAFTAYYFIVL